MDALRELLTATLPIVSANDDGTTSVEWRTATAVLHVMFEGDRGEVYFENGTDEWEQTIPTRGERRQGAREVVAVRTEEEDVD